MPRSALHPIYHRFINVNTVLQMAVQISLVPINSSSRYAQSVERLRGRCWLSVYQNVLWAVIADSGRWCCSDRIYEVLMIGSAEAD